MPRVKCSVSSRARRLKVIKAAKGYRGRRSKLYRSARESVHHALQYSYIHRRLRKRDFRRLWIIRINAAARAHGLTYGRLIDGLKKAEVLLDRKILAELAVNDTKGFGKLVELAKQTCGT